MRAAPRQSWGFPDAVAVPPPTVPRSKVLRLGARARKGLEMMSQKPRALLIPPPPGPRRLRRTDWLGRRGGQGRKREGHGDPS